MLEQNFTLAFLFDGWTLKQKKNRLTTRVLMQTNTFFSTFVDHPITPKLLFKTFIFMPKKDSIYIFMDMLIK